MLEQIFDYLKSPPFWTSVFLTIVFVVLWNIIGHFKKGLKKVGRIDELSMSRQQSLRTIYRIIRVVMLVLFILAILQVNGINVTSLVAGLGVTSVVVAFALQDVLKDLLMGFDIAAENFFSVGDVIRFELPLC